MFSTNTAAVNFKTKVGFLGYSILSLPLFAACFDLSLIDYRICLYTLKTNDCTGPRSLL